MDAKNYRFNEEKKPRNLMKIGNIKYPTHFHPQVEIVFCVSGGYSMLIDGISYELTEGDAMIIYPNQRHYYKVLDPNAENCAYLLLSYPSDSPDFCSKLTCFKPKHPIIKKYLIPESVPKIFELFFEDYKRKGMNHVFKGYTELIIEQLVPLLEVEPVEKETMIQDIQVVLDYIDRHFREDITLKSVAKELGFHPNYLSTFFQDKMKISFNTHIREMRVESAREMLETTGHTANEICQYAGFQSKRTFFRCFHEKYGMTPLEYRKSMQESKTAKGK